MSNRQRIVALTLLLWVLADLGMQGSCCLEKEQLQVAAARWTSSPASDDSQDNQNREEACFCCCTHILPAQHVALIVSTIVSQELVFRVLKRPTDFNTPVYHPPRVLAA